jgi:hypothetical protein
VLEKPYTIYRRDFIRGATELDTTINALRAMIEVCSLFVKGHAARPEARP